MEDNNVKESKGRSKWKSNARKVIRAHYLLLVVLCLVSVFYGTEFGYITERTENMYEVISGNESFQEALGLDLNVYEYDENQNTDPQVDISVGNDDADDGQTDKAESDSALRQLLRDNVAEREHGIFASVANTLSSGKVQQVIVRGISSVISSESVASAILVLLATLVSVLIYVFIKRIYMSMMRRMFLEARTYKTVPVTHLLYFKYVGRWIRACLTLLVGDILFVLWSLTFVGFFIKRYSYFAVPYIVAENPDIKPIEAVTLSRRMMDGHKWEACKLELSFIGWDLLGVVTFGFSDTLWAIPYKISTYCEYYAYLRERAKANGVEGSDLLNDVYLYEHAAPEIIDAEYEDIEEQEKYIEEHEVVLSPFRSFMAENFGLWIGRSAEKKAYDEVEGRERLIVNETAMLDGEMYPLRLSPLWKKESTHTVRKISYLRTYTITSVIMIFFAFSLVGWLWEVGIHLVNDGVFVNRGCMHGPWLPIYGGGVAMIIVLLARWRNKKYAEALSIVLLCGCVEYFTSYYLELTKGLRWWDYTGYFLNLNGRICGEGLMVFAIGGMVAVYLLAPILDSMLSRINTKALITISIVLMMCFAADVVYSHYVPNTGEGITDYEAYTQTSMHEIVIETDDPGTGLQRLL